MNRQIGPANALDAAGVVSCDNIETNPVGSIGNRIGYCSRSRRQTSPKPFTTRSTFTDP